MTQPTGPRRPVSSAVAATQRPVTPAPAARPPVATGRPVTTAIRRPGTQVVTSTSHPGITTTSRRPVAPAGTITRRPVPQSTTTIRRPGTQVITSTRRPVTTAATATTTTHRRVTGWPHHGKKHAQAHPSGTTSRHTTVHRKHPGGGTAVTRHGRHITHAPGRPTPGRRHVRYVPGRPGYSTVYYPGAPGPVDNIEQVHPGQPVPAGTVTPIGQPTPAGSYGSCPSAGPASMTGSTPVTGHAPAPSVGSASTTTTPRPCHNCGTSIRGCTTLSRFAFNSVELKSSHKSQLRALAERILRQSSNAVIATGHTDSSGTEDYNEALGERRAAAVVKELKKQLALLKPGSQKALFWKTDSKGETRPVSGTDAAANRRVTICVRKGSFAR